MQFRSQHPSCVICYDDVISRDVIKLESKDVLTLFRLGIFGVPGPGAFEAPPPP